MATGQLVFVDGEGTIVALDLLDGKQKRFPMVDTVATGLALSPRGKQLAFVAQPKSEAQRPQVVVLDVASGDRNTIEPEPAQYVGDLRWGGSGTLLYRTYGKRKDGENRVFAVAEGAKAGKLFARDAWLKTADQGVGVAYVACTDKKAAWECAQRLVIDSAIGGAERVLADKRRFELLSFTPDGRFLLTIDRVGEEQRVTRYDTDGGEALDLGSGTALHTSLVYGTWVSPDSTEALVRRGSSVVTVKLDGSGERTIASGEIESAGFVTQRGVLYAERKNLAPGNDVPEYRDALWYVDGDRRAQIADFAHCSWPSVSRSGRLVARACEDGIHMYSLESGKELRSIARMGDVLWPTLLGFDGREVALVVAYGEDSALANADHALRLHGIDGGDRELGVAHTHPVGNDGVGWPSFAFAAGKD